MVPHSIPHQLGHLNYNPLKVGQNVDKWHVDTLRIDYVMFVTDPNAVEGGEFEYFRGTKHEVKALHGAGQTLPPERTIAPRLPGPGYAVLQQGNMVVHRAKGLRRAAERITMVNGYVPSDFSVADYTRFDQLALADPAHIAAPEYARHAAWLGRERLQALIDEPLYNADRMAIAAASNLWRPIYQKRATISAKPATPRWSISATVDRLPLKSDLVARRPGKIGDFRHVSLVAEQFVHRAAGLVDRRMAIGVGTGSELAIAMRPRACAPFRSATGPPANRRPMAACIPAHSRATSDCR